SSRLTSALGIENNSSLTALVNLESSLLKQLCECLTSIRRSSRRSFALDYSSWSEQFAHVARVFVDDACGNWFTALEAGGRIEVCALTTGVKVSVACWAGGGEIDVRRGLCSTGGALHQFAECHHFWRAWAFAITRLWRRLRWLRVMRFLLLTIGFHVAEI